MKLEITTLRSHRHNPSNKQARKTKNYVRARSVVDDPAQRKDTISVQFIFRTLVL